MAKIRVDRLLVEKGYFPSRERAQRAILEGKVRVNNVLVDKASFKVDEAASVTVEPDMPYVSRGGVKLRHALTVFNVGVRGKIALDIGASTGGFTDCLLQCGASKVYAVDVGYGQIAWKLRNDPKVVIMERKNARYLLKGDIKDVVNVVTMDVSFISIKKILPVLPSLVSNDFEAIVLIKPQFEVGREHVGRGIVRDPLLHVEVLMDIRDFAERELPFSMVDVCYSPIKGAKGNIEFFGLFGYGEVVPESAIKGIVEEAHEKLG